MRVLQKWKDHAGVEHIAHYRVDANSQFKAEHNGPCVGVSGIRSACKVQECPQMLASGSTYKVRRAREAVWLLFISEVEVSLKL